MLTLTLALLVPSALCLAAAGAPLGEDAVSCDAADAVDVEETAAEAVVASQQLLQTQAHIRGEAGAAATAWEEAAPAEMRRRFETGGGSARSGSFPTQEMVAAALARMRAEPSVAAVQKASCGVIGARADQDTQKDWFLDLGGFDPPIDALRRFPDDEELQLLCEGAIASMCLYNKRNMEAAGDKGAVELTVGIMRKWSEDPRAQIGGNMGCYMDFSETNRARWAKAGGIELNIASIDRFFNDSGVLVQAWYAFSSGTQPPNAERFVAAGGIERALRTMEHHPTGFRVREETMQAMRQVGLTPALSHKAIDMGWLKWVVTALRDAPTDLHQQSAGCANLAIYASQNTTHRSVAVREGAAEVAMAGLQNFARMKSGAGWPAAYDMQYTVREDCLEALAALAPDPEGQARLQAAGAAVTAQALMEENPLNIRIQLAGRKFL